ncbi:hypothetical protein [Sinorhizobium meliloti]|uniref:hypothetical protein n=1 Tax=Rhizobium meliloti TaxID=382 RepID=UPI0013E3D8B7|nr:hypothetical protein [Sinorhizobium meliloti]MDX0254273.1 hypothetical protein [Sinorhizobium meliloti]
MDKLSQDEQDEIVRSYSEKVKAIVGDMDALRGDGGWQCSRPDPRRGRGNFAA